MRLWRRGFLVHYVALSIWLVGLTVLAVGVVLIQAVARQIERDADRRLADGAEFVATSLPGGTVTSGLGETLALALPLAVVITLAGAVATYLLARRILRPVLILAEAAARLRDSEFLTPMPAVMEPEPAPLADELDNSRLRIRETLHMIAAVEERQQTLFAALREPVLTTSAEGRITSFNAAAADLLGSYIRLHGERLDKFLPFVDVSAEVGGESKWQGHIRAPQGATRDVEVTRTRIAAGTFPRTDIYVVHDITQHVQLSRMREQLLYSVAHEVRGPLSILDNVLDILAHDSDELTADDRGRLARSARSTVSRLHNIVESLLSAGSIQSGRFEVHPTPTCVSLIIDEAIQAAIPLIEARNQRIEQHFPGDDLQVVADRRYVRQLLWNLLNNASKYSPDGELIRVRAEAADGHVRITVQDFGCGIPLDQQPGLFERFYRTQSAEQTEGIGLGLAIAKAIADAHEGTIGVESEPGNGTRVWFTLPISATCAD